MMEEEKEVGLEMRMVTKVVVKVVAVTMVTMEVMNGRQHGGGESQSAWSR